jgi:hypothetical protein
MQRVLTKHGLTEKALAEIKVTYSDERSRNAGRAAIGGLIRDPMAFVHDLLAADRAVRGTFGPARMLPFDSKSAKLEALKVNGAHASATLVANYKGGFWKRQEVQFIRGRNGWRLLPLSSPVSHNYYDTIHISTR